MISKHLSCEMTVEQESITLPVEGAWVASVHTSNVSGAYAGMVRTPKNVRACSVSQQCNIIK